MSKSDTILLLLYLIPMFICAASSFTEAYLRAYRRGTTSDAQIAAILMFSVVPVMNAILSLIIIHELFALIVGEVISSIRSRR